MDSFLSSSLLMKQRMDDRFPSSIGIFFHLVHLLIHWRFLSENYHLGNLYLFFTGTGVDFFDELFIFTDFLDDFETLSADIFL